MLGAVAVLTALGATLTPLLWISPAVRTAEKTLTRRVVDTRVLIIGGCMVVGAFTGSFLLPVCAGGVTVAWSPTLAAIESRRNAQAVALAWPATLEVLSMGVSVAMPIHELIGFVVRCGPAPHRRLFEHAEAILAAGGTRREALLSLAVHGGDPIRPVVDVLVAADRDGASVALVLDRLAAEAGRAHRLLAEERARRAPVLMLAPLTLCSLPAVLIGTIAPFVLLTFGQTSF